MREGIWNSVGREKSVPCETKRQGVRLIFCDGKEM